MTKIFEIKIDGITVYHGNYCLDDSLKTSQLYDEMAQLYGDNPVKISNIQLELNFPEENKEKSNGCFCTSCKEFNDYGEPNQPDKTFICYACRNGL